MSSRTIEKDVRQMLGSMYPGRECIMLEEVSNASGFARNRSIDFVVMNLWPSRGLHLTGFELKQSRNDWLRELKQPAKAESYVHYFDYWYLITTSDTMAQMSEVPETWGWLAVRGNKLVVMKPAPRNPSPTPPDRSFLACLLRRADVKEGWVRTDTIEDRIDIAKQEGRNESKRMVDSAQQSEQRLQAKINEFEQASGFNIGHRWPHDAKEIGTALKWYMEGGLQKVKDELAKVQQIVTALKETTDLVIKVSEITIQLPT